MGISLELYPRNGEHFKVSGNNLAELQLALLRLFSLSDYAGQLIRANLHVGMNIQEVIVSLCVNSLMIKDQHNRVIDVRALFAETHNGSQRVKTSQEEMVAVGD